MLKKINDLLAGLPMTIVAGVFLLIDLVPHLAEEFGGTPMQLSVLPFDPAWVTVLISGIPLWREGQEGSAQDAFAQKKPRLEASATLPKVT